MSNNNDIRTLTLTGSDIESIADLLGLTVSGHNENTRPKDQEYIVIELASSDSIPVTYDEGVTNHRAIAFDPEAGREEGVIVLA